ncbi:hypothetical protein [Candidatus Neptunochlamydia vexilliferae]|uniref:Uncharacterized protein n=1 Tax=Candidatus Neptunichlamydia vexilliferae TaxID=1651774 RepID=A0ABS0B0R5_9BACT|nr:hypothetical protein [Candidatus Neptunochlamydia vexilliferae]MBF5059987.1 hypothetical protein [Candidatus Neptunochlamydia vexilliferae]
MAFTQFNLQSLFKDSSVDGYVRCPAAEALVEYLKLGGDGVKEVVEGLFKFLKNSSFWCHRESIARALRKSSPQQLAKMVSDTRSFKLALAVCYLTQKALTVSEKEITISDNRTKILFPADKNYLKLVGIQKIINSLYSSLVNGIFDHSWQNTSSSSTSSSSSTFNTSKSHDRY